MSVDRKLIPSPSNSRFDGVKIADRKLFGSGQRRRRRRLKWALRSERTSSGQFNKTLSAPISLQRYAAAELGRLWLFRGVVEFGNHATALATRCSIKREHIVAHRTECALIKHRVLCKNFTGAWHIHRKDVLSLASVARLSFLFRWCGFQSVPLWLGVVLVPSGVKFCFRIGLSSYAISSSEYEWVLKMLWVKTPAKSKSTANSCSLPVQ